MKKFIKASSVLLICSLAIGVFCSCGSINKISAESDNPFALAGIDKMPEGADINVSVPTDEKKQTDLAVKLYEQAILKDKNLDYRAISTICNTHNESMGIDNQVLLNIFEMKNDKAFYRIDYRLNKDCPLLKKFPSLNDSLQLVSTQRRYQDLTMDVPKYQMVNNADVYADGNKKGQPYAKWDKIVADKDPYPEKIGMKRIFDASQKGDFSPSDHTINKSTIKSGTVKKLENGDYEVELVMNRVKATLKTVVLIQEGAKDSQAKYDVLTYKFVLHKNGYFKTFNATEEWSGEAMRGKIPLVSIGINSKFEYQSKFSYDEQDCNMKNYYKNGKFVD